MGRRATGGRPDGLFLVFGGRGGQSLPTDLAHFLIYLFTYLVNAQAPKNQPFIKNFITKPDSFITKPDWFITKPDPFITKPEELLPNLRGVIAGPIIPA